jgi:hypothetical protein
VLLGQAFLRAADLLRGDETLQIQLARTLRADLRVGRLTLLDVMPVLDGSEWHLLPARAMRGLPDSLISAVGAEAVLCLELNRLVPLFVQGGAVWLGDLSLDTGPFVADMESVYTTGPNGRRIVERIVGYADRYPDLGRFVHRVAAGLAALPHLSPRGL